MPTIVQVNVTQTVGAAPATLQKTGALISQGGTTTSPGTATLITQEADLTAILTAPAPLTQVVVAGAVVTATTTSPHGYTVGSQIVLTMAGITDGGLGTSAYNGTYLCTITSTTQYTYNLGQELILASGTGGTYVPQSAIQLTAMGNTFFAQGSGLSCYVLELGPGNTADGVAALAAYIQANPNSDYTPGAEGYFYAYVVPKQWDGNADFLALLAEFESTTARTYFFITTTLATYGSYTNLMKCAITLIESPQFGTYGANALTDASWSNGAVTFTTTTTSGISKGDWFTIEGCTPSAYNGTYQAVVANGVDVTAYKTVNPGTLTVPGSLKASLYGNAGAPVTEFTVAAVFWNFLDYNPSAANLVAPFAFKYLYGVTPFPTRGNNALLTTLKAESVNVVGTGAEGGISNTILLWGTTMDGHDATYWYSVDWVQINVDIAISNAVINGSNNSQNPLYYDQNGINRLQAVAQTVMRNAIAFGLALAPITVNAVPFVTYVSQNPADYPAGIYRGLSVSYTPQRGFIQIVFYVNVSSFPAGG
jgi:hypothetical protein